MSDGPPVFRLLMGSNNAFFDEARENAVALKHVPVDFLDRYRKGDTDGLEADFRAAFHARFPEFEGPLNSAWVSRYLNDARRFAETPHLRFVTYKASQVWWAETTQPAQTWRLRYEGDANNPVPIELLARPLETNWTRKTLDGADIASRIHPAALRSLSYNRSEFGQANPEIAGYVNALVADRDLTPWHTQRDWIRAAAVETTRQPRGRAGAVRSVKDILNDHLEQQRLSYETVRSGRTAGYVYAISSPGHPEWIKVGFTTRELVAHRKSDLQTGNPFQLEVVHAAFSPVSQFAEHEAHAKLLSDLPASRRGIGEWFRITPAEAREAIDYGVSLEYAATRDLGLDRASLQEAIDAEARSDTADQDPDADPGIAA